MNLHFGQRTIFIRHHGGMHGPMYFQILRKRIIFPWLAHPGLEVHISMRVIS